MGSRSRCLTSTVTDIAVDSIGRAAYLAAGINGTDACRASPAAPDFDAKIDGEGGEMITAFDFQNGALTKNIHSGTPNLAVAEALPAVDHLPSHGQAVA